MSNGADTSKVITNDADNEENVEKQQNEKKTGFDIYCDANPSAPECLMYDN